MNFKKRIAVAITTGAIMLSAFAPAVSADIQIDITGNGRNSTNNVGLDFNNTSNVSQNNTANVTNSLKVKANTGGNKVHDTGDGDVNITTGNISVNQTVNNTVGTNELNVTDCGCTGPEVAINVSDNKRNTDNTVDGTVVNDHNKIQKNNITLRNRLKVKAKTGKNKVHDTGIGNVDVTTDNVEVDQKVTNTGPTNTVTVTP